MEYNDKQLQIMETAELLFAEKGFHGTSVRDIAEAANINIAMISYYFGSKDKLLEAIFDMRGEAMKLKLESILRNEELTSLEKMYLLVDHYVDKVLNRQNFHKILSREQVLNNTDPIFHLILDMRRRNLQIITQLIKEGQKKGEFKKKIDVAMLLSTMVGTAGHLITTQQYYREIKSLQSLSDKSFQQHIKKILTGHLKTVFKNILTHEE